MHIIVAFLLLLCVQSVVPYVVREDHVTFYLHTREQQEVQVTKETIGLIDGNKNFHFLAHGWIGSHTTSWFVELTEAYLEREDCNVIQIDWTIPAQQYHYVSANNTRGVGYYVGDFIVKLMEDLEVAPENIHIVGHSFGAHVAGFAGKQVFKQLNRRIGRITTVDPARRPFENSLITKSRERLFYDDAEVVVGVHTDAGFRGFVGPVGTIDFYPNGGKAPQPGCEGNSFESNSDYIHVCSHNLSPDLFIEAVGNPSGFVSTKCTNYEDYVDGKCDGNEKVTLGGDLSGHEGIFYFQTNPQKPYSKD